MYNILYSLRARDDLKNIIEFIAQDNPHYAGKVVNKISTFLKTYLSIFPAGGTAIDQTKNIRLIVEPTIILDHQKNLKEFAFGCERCINERL